MAAGRLLTLVALAAGSGRAQTSEGLRVVPLVSDDQVLVSFTLNDGFTDEVRAAIQSGLKTTFTYAAELRLDVPGWVDRTMATSTATSSVEYDNLTRRYALTRSIDGQVVDTRVGRGRARRPALAHGAAAAPALPHVGARGQPRVLRDRSRHRAAEQRLHPLAVQQRHLRAGQVHLHQVG